jgi:hypothetical protein
MPSRFALWALLTLTGLAACTAPPTGARDAEPPRAASSAIMANGGICAKEAIPSGYVVVSARNNVRCGAIRSGVFNEYIVARLGNVPLAVCSVSKVPGNWAITLVTGSNSCPESLQFGWTQNQYRIEPLAGYRMVVCSLSGIPAGWVATAADRSSTCTESRISGQVQNRYVIQQLSLFNSLSICTRLSSTPPGWVVTQVRTAAVCPAAAGSVNLNQYDVVRITNQRQMTVCSLTIPAGWIVVSRSNTSACPSDPRGGTVVIRR